MIQIQSVNSKSHNSQLICMENIDKKWKYVNNKCCHHKMHDIIYHNLTQSVIPSNYMNYILPPLSLFWIIYQSQSPKFSLKTFLWLRQTQSQRRMHVPLFTYRLLHVVTDCLFTNRLFAAHLGPRIPQHGTAHVPGTHRWHGGELGSTHPDGTINPPHTHGSAIKVSQTFHCVCQCCTLIRNDPRRSECGAIRWPWPDKAPMPAMAATAGRSASEGVWHLPEKHCQQCLFRFIIHG